LPIGVACTQAAHAAIDFQHENVAESLEWHKSSNYLAILTVKDEQELIDLMVKVSLRGIKYTIFREPDLENQITAVALEATNASKKVTSSLPLLGKEVSYA
jgi:peptidyl-tRNA hydrolase